MVDHLSEAVALPGRFFFFSLSLLPTTVPH